MKKLLSLFLAVVMILSLCACGGSGSGNGEEAKVDNSLEVGYGKINITPSYTVGLGGYSDAETRRSQAVADRIYATCIALTFEQNTVLLYTVDTCAMTKENAEYFRVLIMANTGVPTENIFFGATHCHSAPSIGGQYKDDLMQWLVKAGRKAMTDRSPAKLMAATPEIEGMNFVRHYVMGDGTYHGSNFGSQESGFVGHAAPTDPRMILVQLQREE